MSVRVEVRCSTNGKRKDGRADLPEDLVDEHEEDGPLPVHHALRACVVRWIRVCLVRPNPCAIIRSRSLPTTILSPPPLARTEVEVEVEAAHEEGHDDGAPQNDVGGERVTAPVKL